MTWLSSFFAKKTGERPMIKWNLFCILAWCFVGAIAMAFVRSMAAEDGASENFKHHLALAHMIGFVVGAIVSPIIDQLISRLDFFKEKRHE